MNYVCLQNFAKCPIPESQPTHDPALMETRRRLVNQFKAAIGLPEEPFTAMQNDFIHERMSYHESAAYIRYYEYMIIASNVP